MKAIYKTNIKALIAGILLIGHSLSAQTILRVNVNTPCTSGCDGSTWALAYPDLQSAITAFSSGEIWVAAGIYKPSTTGDRAARFELKTNMSVFGGFNGLESSQNERNVTTNPTILSGDLSGNDVGTTNNSENSTNVVGCFYQTGVVLDGFTIKGGNAETNPGGGVYGAVGSLTVQNCIFEYNYAKYGGALNWSHSGGTSTTTATFNVKNCIFRHNQGLYGGSIAFRLFDGVTTSLIENCLFENNQGDTGGAVYGITGSVTYHVWNSTIKGCIFKNNNANYGGAVSFTNGKMINQVLNCQFTGNTASYGGAINNGEGQQIYTNCLIAKNNANYGGAVATPEATQFINCTFSSNTGTHGTCFRSATTATTLTNCVLWNQTAPIDNASAVVNYCDVQGGWATGTGNINTDPLFTDVAMDDYRLQTTSPCRNVGSNAANTEPNDLSGYGRILDGTIDLGAYEGDGGPSNSIGVLVTDAAFATAIRNLCPTCIDGLNYLTTVAQAQTSLSVNGLTISNLTGINGFSSLTTLNASNNSLTSLPTNLPASLTTLNVSNNGLTSLPTGLPTGLTTLNISNNSLSSLPTLPTGLTNLTVSNNNLTSLPTLPSNLTTLNMDNNSITCLPTLPNSLATFVYDAADILCIPNKPTALTTTADICAAITTHPSVSGAACSGSSVSLTATANSISPMTVKWQRKGSGDADYSDVLAAATYSSNTNATYTFSTTISDNNALYRAVFTPSCSNTATTAATLSVINPPTAPASTDTNHSLSFDGTNDCIQISNCLGAAFPFTDAITIEYWFKGSSMQSAVRFQPDADTYIVSGWNNKHIISTSNGTTGVNVGTGATDGNWHHVAMTWQKGVTNGFIPYLDGVRGTRRTATNVNLPTMTSGFYLGSNNGMSEFMNGTIDEVRVWNVVRSQADILANMCSLTLPQTGLVMYYRFNHGIADGVNTVNTLANMAQSDYTGILNNFNLSGSSSNFNSSVPSSCPAIVLPIEFVDFNGKNTEGGNELTWTTGSEVNTQLFEIQRLNKPNEFETLGKVTAVGKAATYTFIDNKPLGDINHYRLKIVDFDAKTTFSKTISIENSKILRGVKVYPNPVSDVLTIENVEGQDIDIINVLGQIVFAEKNIKRSSFSISHFEKGVYFVKTSGRLVKFIKN